MPISPTETTWRAACLSETGGRFPEYVYRIVPLAIAVQTIQGRRNALVTPLRWDDQFEAIQLRTGMHLPVFADAESAHLWRTGSQMPLRIAENVTWTKSRKAASAIVCQCWSAVEDNDTMWRAYSPELQSVKLKSRTRELVQSLTQVANADPVFLGRVGYLPQSEIEALGVASARNHRLQTKPSAFSKIEGKPWAQCLLRKRDQFIYEQEYRLITIPSRERRQLIQDNLFFYDVDPNSIFDEIQTDPRSKNHSETAETLRRAGYSGPVTKSGIYAMPNYTVKTHFPKNMVSVNTTFEDHSNG